MYLDHYPDQITGFLTLRAWYRVMSQTMRTKYLMSDSEFSITTAMVAQQTRTLLFSKEMYVHA